jgi:hypothetical protein
MTGRVWEVVDLAVDTDIATQGMQSPFHAFVKARELENIGDLYQVAT